MKDILSRFITNLPSIIEAFRLPIEFVVVFLITLTEETKRFRLILMAAPLCFKCFAKNNIYIFCKYDALLRICLGLFLIARIHIKWKGEIKKGNKVDHAEEAEEESFTYVAGINDEGNCTSCLFQLDNYPAPLHEHFQQSHILTPLSSSHHREKQKAIIPPTDMKTPVQYNSPFYTPPMSPICLQQYSDDTRNSCAGKYLMSNSKYASYQVETGSRAKVDENPLNINQTKHQPKRGKRKNMEETKDTMDNNIWTEEECTIQTPPSKQQRRQ